MKRMTVFEAGNHFARTLEAAKDDVIIVTRNGKPVAATHAIGDDDIEDPLLERSEKLWEMIARARRGRPIAIETL
jgi:antitoxin (DNA-binding transcriptional repressor) of toxin-antitoxin stability system